MTKKIETPSPITFTYLPQASRYSPPVSSATWKVMTKRTAIARSESNRGNRGLPGGGATAGETPIGGQHMGRRSTFSWVPHDLIRAQETRPHTAKSQPMATAERTLVKSQPELWQLLDERERMQGLMSALVGRATEIEVTEREPETRLAWEGAVADECGSIEIELEKKGWGTHVVISAAVDPAWDGIDGWLDAVFEELSAPERRPFEGVL